MSGRIRLVPVGGQHSTLVGSSVFLRCPYVASGLLPYEEHILLSSTGREPAVTSLSQREAYAGCSTSSGRP